MKLSDLRLVSNGGWLGGTTLLWKFGVALTFMGLVMYIVGFSTDWWCVLDHEENMPVRGVIMDAHFGLWRKCYRTFNSTGWVFYDGCEDMDNDEAYKPAAKVLCSIGLILALLALPVAILAACGQNPKAMIYAGVITIVAGCNGIVGAAVYIGKALDEEDSLEADYSLFLALVGLVTMSVGATLQLLSIRIGYQSIA